jgi:diadenosine tetraphosphate (Ap4A) HIT family hydrolase
MTNHDCLICSLQQSKPAARIFLDDQWAAEIAPGYEVPGWFFLRARRHAEALPGLDEIEAATFGTRARDLALAVEKATGAPAVYLLHFGESYRHFHALVVARGDGVPVEFRGGAILQLLNNGRDLGEAVEVASRVRSAYDDIVGEREIERVD